MDGRSYRKTARPTSIRHIRTDWLSWILHGILGLVVGAVIGVWIYFRIIDRLDKAGPMPLFIFGSALIAGGLGSIFGERLWGVNKSRLEMTEGVKASIYARILSGGIILTGIAMAAYCIMK